MNFVSDTHALVWWFTGSPKLGEKASKTFTSCERGESVIVIPSIVLAEALSIFDKKRVSFNFRSLFRQVRESENFVIMALDYPVLETMLDLQHLPELHDKIIVATAKHLELPLITKDATLRKLSNIKTIW
jgi:PIN domain nuclease of toxin-antitoxin system